MLSQKKLADESGRERFGAKQIGQGEDAFQKRMEGLMRAAEAKKKPEDEEGEGEGETADAEAPPQTEALIIDPVDDDRTASNVLTTTQRLRPRVFRQNIENPQESCGHEIKTNRVGRLRRVWSACGPALEQFQRGIMAEVQTTLRNTVQQHADIYIQLYMIGIRREVARPTIMVCCTDRSARNEVERLLRASAIFEKYPEFGLGASALPLEQSVPAQAL